MPYYVIYWEAPEKNGFVSYGNTEIKPEERDEYHPVPLRFATKYKTRKDAERTMNWYVERGGFGQFYVLKVK